MPKNPLKILVAGDVCLDVVAVPMPPPSAPCDPQAENWRLTGETRTHFLPGGALLLAEFVRSAMATSGGNVFGPCAIPPRGVGSRVARLLDTPALLRLAPRLCRKEVVHSLLRLDCFPTKPKSKKHDKTLRVTQEAGFSGPDQAEPTLCIRYRGSERADILVLDDTGNRFRKRSARNPWPAALTGAAGKADEGPLVIYKLHRPLPGTKAANPLWKKVRDCFPKRVVIVSVNDLRAAGAPISEGLSWERTALDVVWQLSNVPSFAALRECPWLIIRLGLDGAILWQWVKSADEKDGQGSAEAWLIYDPNGIEGSFAQQVPGRMVGSASAFTAGLVNRVSQETGLTSESLIEACKEGLLASRRLFQKGYGPNRERPVYPGTALFEAGKDETKFAHQRIPTIFEALVPDRGAWRLLDQLFSGKTSLLHRAVTQVATSSKPPEKTGAGSDETGDREREAAAILKQVPLGVFGKLRTYDRFEIESYRSLHTLLSDYLCQQATRPLSFAVFGPPGAGKSFAVTEVAASLKDQPGCREVKDLTFNLSLYQKPEELAGAFHLVRDVVLEGKVPLVFFDEFDTALGGEPLGWLRHFLAPMQDGKFLDRDSPHPIGQSIFVFAGGTCGTFAEFKSHPGMEATEFRRCKGPDFLSRLRATMDIPSLNLLTAHAPPPYPHLPGQPPVQPPGTFDPFGPIESLPCEAAILLRRAAVLSFGLKKKAPTLIRADESLAVSPEVLRALMFLPAFKHGNRSFEALLDMSHVAGVDRFAPCSLPAPFQIPLHADENHFGQLIDVDFPFPHEDRERIAQEIHRRYLAQRENERPPRAKDASCKPWQKLAEDLRESNRSQADDITAKLRAVKLWYRKSASLGRDRKAAIARGSDLLEPHVETLARAEHDRWTAQKRRQGWIAAANNADNSKDEKRRLSHCLFPWEDLREDQKDLDRVPIRNIPKLLAIAAYEIIQP